MIIIIIIIILIKERIDNFFHSIFRYKHDKLRKMKIENKKNFNQYKRKYFIKSLLERRNNQKNGGEENFPFIPIRNPILS